MRFAMMGAAAAALLAAAPANATDFSFTFSTDLANRNVTNGVAGSVTGRILGLADNATSSSYSVFIDSFTAPGFSGVPTNAAYWNEQLANSFTVRDGMIVAASFHADRTAQGVLDRLYINYVENFQTNNYASVGVNNAFSIWNQQGLSGVQFAAIPGVPEPSTWALMILGFGLVGLGLRQKRWVAVRFA